MPRKTYAQVAASAPVTNTKCDKTTQSPQTSSNNDMQNSKPTGKSILDLPAELRNEIYGYALRQDEPVRPGRIGDESALLRVSRQVREEAINMYWAVNDLEFDFRDDAGIGVKAPAIYWAYYHIPAGTMLVGQKLVLHANRFVATLEQRSHGRDANGKERKGLALVDLELKYSFERTGDDKTSNQHLKSINRDLDFVFASDEIDMLPWLGHNVIRGLLKFFNSGSHAWYTGPEPTALHAIGGEMPMGDVGGYRFYEGWI